MRVIDSQEFARRGKCTYRLRQIHVHGLYTGKWVYTVYRRQHIFTKYIDTCICLIVCTWAILHMYIHIVYYVCVFAVDVQVVYSGMSREQCVEYLDKMAYVKTHEHTHTHTMTYICTIHTHTTHTHNSAWNIWRKWRMWTHTHTHTHAHTHTNIIIHTPRIPHT